MRSDAGSLHLSPQKRVLSQILCEWNRYVEEEGWRARAYLQVFALKCIENWHKGVIKIKRERDFVVDVLLEKKVQSLYVLVFQTWVWQKMVDEHQGWGASVINQFSRVRQTRTRKTNNKRRKSCLKDAVNLALQVELWRSNQRETWRFLLSSSVLAQSIAWAQHFSEWRAIAGEAARADSRAVASARTLRYHRRLSEIIRVWASCVLDDGLIEVSKSTVRSRAATLRLSLTRWCAAADWRRDIHRCARAASAARQKAVRRRLSVYTQGWRAAADIHAARRGRAVRAVARAAILQARSLAGIFAAWTVLVTVIADRPSKPSAAESLSEDRSTAAQQNRPGPTTAGIFSWWEEWATMVVARRRRVEDRSVHKLRQRRAREALHLLGSAAQRRRRRSQLARTSQERGRCCVLFAAVARWGAVVRSRGSVQRRTRRGALARALRRWAMATCTVLEARWRSDAALAHWEAGRPRRLRAAARGVLLRWICWAAEGARRGQSLRKGRAKSAAVQRGRAVSAWRDRAKDEAWRRRAITRLCGRAQSGRISACVASWAALSAARARRERAASRAAERRSVRRAVFALGSWRAVAAAAALRAARATSRTYGRTAGQALSAWRAECRRRRAGTALDSDEEPPAPVEVVTPAKPWETPITKRQADRVVGSGPAAAGGLLAGTSACHQEPWETPMTRRQADRVGSGPSATGARSPSTPATAPARKRSAGAAAAADGGGREGTAQGTTSEVRIRLPDISKLLANHRSPNRSRCWKLSVAPARDRRRIGDIHPRAVSGVDPACVRARVFYAYAWCTVIHPHILSIRMYPRIRVF
jgi:hypothetical protein